jgi:hypothetical protein
MGMSTPKTTWSTPTIVENSSPSSQGIILLFTLSTFLFFKTEQRAPCQAIMPRKQTPNKLVFLLRAEVDRIQEGFDCEWARRRKTTPSSCLSACFSRSLPTSLALTV